MQDLFGFSGAAKEIVNAISQGVGTLYRPRAIRNEAEAEAHATKIKAKAEAEANIIVFDTYEKEFERRVVARFKNSLIRQQTNLDQIVEEAITIANSDDGIGQTKTYEHIDQDWIARFINYAQDVSKEQLQGIWSHILARKANSSESVSLRTLDVLRNISSEDAEIFERFLKIRNATGEFYPLESRSLLNCGFHSSEFSKLANAKLIEPPKVPWNMVDNSLQQSWPTLHVLLQSISPFIVRISGRIVALYTASGETVTIYAHGLTDEGVELASILNVKANDKQFIDKCFYGVISYFEVCGFKIKIDDEIPEMELEQFKRFENSEEEFEQSQREGYEKWKLELKNSFKSE